MGNNTPMRHTDEYLRRYPWVKRDRNDNIVYLRDAHGVSFNKLAKQYGISMGRTQQIYEATKGQRRG